MISKTARMVSRKPAHIIWGTVTWPLPEAMAPTMTPMASKISLEKCV